MSMAKWIGGCVLALGAAVLVSCGGSPEHDLQRARLALSNNKPDTALQLVAAVLGARPGDPEALLIKSEAHLRLMDFDASRKTLDQLLAANEEKPEARRLMISWVFGRTHSLLRQSDFASNRALQQQFDDALGTGRQQVQWMALQKDRLAESHLYSARFILRDAERYRAMLEAQKRSLANVDLDGGTNPQDSAVVRELESNVNTRLSAARDELNKALQADPALHEASETLVAVLMENQDWADLWVLAQKVSQLQDLPESLASRVVMSLMNMPNQSHPQDERTELAWKVQQAVAPAQQGLNGWKITTARLHILANDAVKAQGLLEDVMKTDARDVNTRYLLARTYAAQNRNEDARKILEKLVTEASRSAQVQSLYGVVLMRVGETTLAKEHLRQATQLDPDDAVARRSLLDLMARDNNLEAMERDVQELIQRNPSDPQALRFKLQFEIARGQRGEVEALINRVQQIDPMTDGHLTVLIDACNYLQRYAEVERYARQLAERDAKNLENQLILVSSLLVQGKSDTARQMLTELRTAFPSERSIDQMLGRVYLQREMLDLAVQTLQGVVDAEPNNTEARLMLARGLAGLSMTDEALEQVKQALEIDGTSAMAHAMAARLYEQQGKLEDANRHLASIDHNRVNERDNPALMAQIKLRQGEADAALEICNRAIAQANTDPVLRLIAARIYMNKDDANQAESHLLAMVRSQPNTPQAFAALSTFYVQSKRADRGLLELQKLYSMNEALARLAQASLLVTLGRVPEAIDRLEPVTGTLVSSRSNNAPLLSEALARLYVQAGQRDKAVAVYDRLIANNVRPTESTLRKIDVMAPEVGVEKTVAELDKLLATLTPDQRALRFQVLRRLAGLKQYDRALKLLDGWLLQQPNQAMLLRWKGELLVESGRGAEAVPVFEKAVELEPQNIPMRVRVAQAHLANRDFPAVERTLVELAEQQPASRVTALASLGEVYLTVGLLDQAAVTFEELEKVGRASDPRVLLAMGRSLAKLNRNDLARARLELIPSYAPQYAPAQILVAQLEQRSGLADKARNRLEKLLGQPGRADDVVRLMVTMDLRDGQVERLAQWADKVLSVDALPTPSRRAWLDVRALLADLAKDLATVQDTLEKRALIDRDDTAVAAQRIAVLLLRGKPDQARQLYTISEGVAKSPYGPLLDSVMGGKPQLSANAPALMRYFVAMNNADVSAAQAAIAQLPPDKVFYRDDLLAITQRPDASSSDMATVHRHLSLAYLSLQLRLPQSSIDLCQRVIDAMPTLAPAYAIQLQAAEMIEQPVAPILARAKRDLPQGSLKTFLSAREKLAAKDYAGAAEALRQIVEKEPTNDHVRYEMTQMLDKAGKPDEAIEELRRMHGQTVLYRLPVANDLAYLTAVHQPQNMEQAYQVAAALAKAQPHPAFLDTLGWIALQRGQKDEALKLLSAAIENLRDIPEAHYHMGMTYLAVGNKAWARHHLTEAAKGAEDKREVADARKRLTEWKD